MRRSAGVGAGAGGVQVFGIPVGFGDGVGGKEDGVFPGAALGDEAGLFLEVGDVLGVGVVGGRGSLGKRIEEGRGLRTENGVWIARGLRGRPGGGLSGETPGEE